MRESYQEERYAQRANRREAPQAALEVPRTVEVSGSLGAPPGRTGRSYRRRGRSVGARPALPRGIAAELVVLSAITTMGANRDVMVDVHRNHTARITQDPVTHPYGDQQYTRPPEPHRARFPPLVFAFSSL